MTEEWEEEEEDENVAERGKRRRGEEMDDGRYRRLATSIFSRISSSNATVRMPLGALGLAIHAALLAGLLDEDDDDEGALISLSTL